MPASERTYQYRAVGIDIFEAGIEEHDEGAWMPCLEEAEACARLLRERYSTYAAFDRVIVQRREVTYGMPELVSAAVACCRGGKRTG